MPLELNPLLLMPYAATYIYIYIVSRIRKAVPYGHVYQ